MQFSFQFICVSVDEKAHYIKKWEREKCFI